MRPIIFTALLALPVLPALIACTDPAGEMQVMPTRADGAAFYAQNCVSCHGADGRGAGIESRNLSPKPADLTTLSAENDGAFPAARTLSYIYGDTRNSHLSRVMPEFGPDMAEDLVPVEIDGVLTPTPRELAGLLAYLESIQE